MWARRGGLWPPRRPGPTQPRGRRRWQRLVAVAWLAGAGFACWREVTVNTVRVVPGRFRLPGITELAVVPLHGAGVDSGAAPDAAANVEGLARAVAEALVHQRCYAVRAAKGAETDFGPGVATNVGGGPGPYRGATDGSAERSASGPHEPTALATLWVTVVAHEVTAEARAELCDDAAGAKTLRCGRRQVLRLRAAFRAVDARTGTVLDARELEVRDTLAERWADASGPMVDADAPSGWSPQANVDGGSLARAQAAAYAALAARFCAEVALHQEPVVAAFYDWPQNDAAVRALEAARRGDWPAATTAFGAVADRLDAAGVAASARAMAHYDLGLALALGGDLARGSYELAWSQAIADTPRTAEAVARVRAWTLEAEAGG